MPNKGKKGIMVAYKSFCKSLYCKHLRGGPRVSRWYSSTYVGVGSKKRASLAVGTAIAYQPRVFSRGSKPVFSLTLSLSPHTSQV